MLVHEPSGGREQVEAVDADGIVHGRRARVKRTRCRTARVRAGSRSNAARFAVSQVWSRGGNTPSGSSSGRTWWTSFRWRACQGGVPGGDPSVDGRDDLPGPRSGSSSRPRPGRTSGRAPQSAWSAARPGVVPCTTRVAIRSVTSGRTRPGSAATWSAGT